jgi:hypothetical protein
MNGKIKYNVSVKEEEAFIAEFGKFWNDQQKRSIASGSRDPFPVDVSTLPDPNTVDPKTDAATARNILLNPKSTFDIGERPFVLPLLPYLSSTGHQVPAEIRLLSEQFDLFLVKYGVDATPQGKEKFAEVKLSLDYPDNQGFLTYSMIPNTELEEIFVAKGEGAVGLDLNLKFKVPEIPVQPGLVIGAGITASSKSNILLNLEYKALVAKVIAVGVNSSYVRWTIRKPQQMIGSVGFTFVLCVPQGRKELPITVEGYYCLERGILWWQRETRVEIKSDKPIVVKLP